MVLGGMGPYTLVAEGYKGAAPLLFGASDGVFMALSWNDYLNPVVTTIVSI